MSIYHVHLVQTVSTTVEVEAGSIDSAREEAWQYAPSPTNSTNHGIDASGDWAEVAVELDGEEVWSGYPVEVDADELARLRAIEAAAKSWAAARVEDGRITGESVVPTAQALLDALGGASA